jgi:hypothetical protein
MITESVKTNVLLGGEFLIKETDPQYVFIPEEFSEEQKMMISAARDFLNKEIAPNVEAIDKQEEGLTVRLLDKAGEIGLLGAAVPEEYGGLGEDFNTNTGISLELGAGFSWSVSFAAHTGIGTLPILYYGTDSQKKNISPDLLAANLNRHIVSPNPLQVLMPSPLKQLLSSHLMVCIIFLMVRRCGLLMEALQIF